MTPTRLKGLHEPPMKSRHQPVNEIAAVLGYEQALHGLGQAFLERGLAPVVVKGQALTDMAYPPNVLRHAGDVDLLVAAHEEAVVAQALLGIGYEEQAQPGRRFSKRLLGERVFVHAVQTSHALPKVVEVHQFLDKVVRRPVDYPGILARARPSRFDGLRFPTPEDLFLLAVLHADVSEQIDETRALNDIGYLLLGSAIDVTAIAERALAWELRGAVLRWVEKLAGGNDESLAAAADDLREAILGTHSDRRSIEMVAGLVIGLVAATFAGWVTAPGARYLVEQLPRHDNPGRFVLEAGRYSVLRVLDHGRIWLDARSTGVAEGA
jgi:hypothetical protein